MLGMLPTNNIEVADIRRYLNGHYFDLLPSEIGGGMWP